MDDTRAYLLGTDDAELARLGDQHRVWASYAREAWKHAGFAVGQDILDAGCGPGDAALELAELVSESGSVVGIDASDKYIATLNERAASGNLPQVRGVVCDVHDMGLDDGSLDGVFARWLLSFVSDPARLISHAARVLKPGGAFVAFDYYNYQAFTLAPRTSAMKPVVDAVIASWADSGGDIDVMLRVPKMMVDSGLQVERIDPVTRIAVPGTDLWNWPLDFFKLFLPKLEAGGFVTSLQSRAFLDAWEERGREPHAFLCIPPMMTVIGRKH
ncbi:MAG: methyltransferase domain-containing protein [Planctomycetota bacterium]|jgi:ubiquinone/menaquinone biosynthesis C-methylase UbiE